MKAVQGGGVAVTCRGFGETRCRPGGVVDGGDSTVHQRVLRVAVRYDEMEQAE